MLLLAAGSLWLFLAAVPVFADGGPHQKDQNSGASSLAADGCAGCHRAHTAKGEMIINAATEEELCLSCHGAASTGSTADVMTGIQYALASAANTDPWAASTAYVAGVVREPTVANNHFYRVTTPGTSDATEPTWPTNGSTVTDGTVVWTDQGTLPSRNSGTQLGALRGGGFDQARMDAGSMTRLTYVRSVNFGTGALSISQRPKIAVGAAEAVTSAHIAMTANGLTLPNVAWGNGAAGSGAGPSADVSCGSCHNPHGNGQFRILNVLRASTTIPEAWIVNIRASYAAAVADPDGIGPIPAMTADTVYTVSSHGLLVDDAITIAGSADTALNANWFVKAVTSTGFTISATKGGLAFDITTGGAGGTVSRTSGVPVTDATLPAAGDTRNYTVMQVKSPTSSSSSNGLETDYLLYASQVVTAATASSFNGIAGTYTAGGGDYFARTVPWNPSINAPTCNPLTAVSQSNPTGTLQAQCSTASSAPNGRPLTFTAQITQWCASCHTRYFANDNPQNAAAPDGATGAAWQYPRPGDSLFNHQHRTVAGRDCLTCHVSHGSNAAMTGEFSSSFPYPNATTSASSRLLKVDNRGTCQACHDPTNTVVAGTLLPDTDPGTPGIQPPTPVVP